MNISALPAPATATPRPAPASRAARSCESDVLDRVELRAASSPLWMAGSSGSSPSTPSAPAPPSPVATPPASSATPSASPASVPARLSGDLLAGPQPAVLWSRPTLGHPAHPLVAPDGSIYVASGDHELAALRPDGTAAWKAEVGDLTYAEAPARGADGRVYVGAADALVALSPTGSPLWSVSFQAPSTPAVGPDGTVYVAAMPSVVEALSPDGEPLWRNPMSLDPHRQAPLLLPEGLVVVTGWTGGVRALSAHDGMRAWDVPDLWATSMPQRGVDGSVVFATRDSLVALDPADGKVRWQSPLEGWVGRLAGPAIDREGRIYVACMDGRVRAFESDGRPAWTAQLSDRPLRATPRIQETPREAIIVQDEDGTVGTFDRDGKAGWTLRLPARDRRLPGRPAVGLDGVVYADDRDGHLVAIVPPEATEACLERLEERLERRAPPIIRTEDEGWIIVGGVRVPVRQA